MEKHYYKELADGSKEWFNGAIILNDMWVINPTEEQILEAGYVLWEEPVYVPTLLDLKNEKVAALVEYDSSDAINGFTFNNIPLWLDKATRVGLMLRFESEKAAEEETTQLWADTTKITLPIDAAINLLHTIEIYASKCYDKTAEHRANIMALETAEEVENYDFTVGYPEKININM